MSEDEVFRIRGKVFGAELGLLKKLIVDQDLLLEDDLSVSLLDRPMAVSVVDKWLCTQLLKPDTLKAAVAILNSTFLDIGTPGTVKKEVLTVPLMDKVPNIPTSNTYKKEFKISGQIDSKSGITYMSLRRQIEGAQKKSYPEYDIIDAIIKSIPPTSGLRRYLEGKENLKLSTTIDILRAHYNEKSATELYNELGQMTQSPKETPTDFLMRTLDVRQKVLFASRESSEDLKYSNELVHNLFTRTVFTGLSNNTIRHELKSTLELTDIRDEVLIETLNKIVSKETERQNKFQKVRVNEVTEEPSKSNTEISQLRAEVLELKNLFKNNTGVRKQYTSYRCRNCESKDLQTCRHCWKCGSGDHFRRGCRQQGNANPSHPQGGM